MRNNFLSPSSFPSPPPKISSSPFQKRQGRGREFSIRRTFSIPVPFSNLVLVTAPPRPSNLTLVQPNPYHPHCRATQAPLLSPAKRDMILYAYMFCILIRFWLDQIYKNMSHGYHIITTIKKKKKLIIVPKIVLRFWIVQSCSVWLYFFFKFIIFHSNFDLQIAFQTLTSLCNAKLKSTSIPIFLIC